MTVFGVMLSLVLATNVSLASSNLRQQYTMYSHILLLNRLVTPDAGYDRSLLGPLVGVEPRSPEKIINLFHTETCNLRYHEENVDQRKEAPSSKEDESAPFVHRGKEGWHSIVETVKEQPVETLCEGGAE